MSTTLGPFAFATSQLIFIIACAVAFGVGWLINKRSPQLLSAAQVNPEQFAPEQVNPNPEQLNPEQQPSDQRITVHQSVPIGDALFRIIVVGLLCARGAFVINYFQSYAASPWSIVNIRDGGFVVWVGLLTGALWTWREWRMLARQAAQQRQQAPHAPSARRAQVSLVISLAIGFSVAAAGNLWLQHTINQTQLPQLTLFSVQGQPVHTAQAFVGEPVVVNLWASWCPPCVREMPLLEDAALNWPEVQIVAINQGESRHIVEQFLTKQQLDLPLVLLDGDSQVGSLIGSQALPTTLFFNSDGSLSYTHIGEFSAATLENALRRLQ